LKWKIEPPHFGRKELIPFCCGKNATTPKSFPLSTQILEILLNKGLRGILL